MKATTLLLLLGAAVTAAAQSSFRAVLNTEPVSEITGAAAFQLEGTNARFTISINREHILPASAWLIGPRSSVSFALGEPRIVIHSPGPWPNGYDGSTAFFGSFVLPPDLFSDFVAGLTTVELRGTAVGDFRGPILPDASPQLTNFGRLGPAFRVGFLAEAPYRYTIETSADFGMANPSVATNVLALSQTFNVTLTDPVATTGARFYRIRRNLCCGDE